MKRIVSISAVLMVVLLLVGCGGVPQATQAELDSLRQEKATWQADEAELSRLQTEQQTWQENQAELSQLQAEQKTWKSNQAELSRLLGENKELKAKLAEASDGLPETSLKDPTTEELVAFLTEDTVDKKEYSNDYKSIDFALDLKQNAEKAGFNTALVVLIHPGKVFHFINAFKIAGDSPGEKLFFVEPQIDHRVRLVIGQDYDEVNSMKPHKHNDKILRIVVIWGPTTSSFQIR